MTTYFCYWFQIFYPFLILSLSLSKSTPPSQFFTHIILSHTNSVTNYLMSLLLHPFYLFMFINKLNSKNTENGLTAKVVRVKILVLVLVSMESYGKVTTVKIIITDSKSPGFWTQDYQQHSFVVQVVSSKQSHFPVDIPHMKRKAENKHHLPKQLANIQHLII